MKRLKNLWWAILLIAIVSVSFFAGGVYWDKVKTKASDANKCYSPDLSECPLSDPGVCWRAKSLNACRRADGTVDNTEEVFSGDGIWDGRVCYTCDSSANTYPEDQGKYKCSIGYDVTKNPCADPIPPTPTPTRRPTPTPTRTPTPTPTPTPTRRPTPTPTRRPTPTPTGTVSPTPTVTVTPTPTPTPTPRPGEPNACGGTCGSNSNCQSGYFCYQGYCRIPACPAAEDCSCQVAPTPTPTTAPVATTTPKTGASLWVELLGLSALGTVGWKFRTLAKRFWI